MSIDVSTYNVAQVSTYIGITASYYHFVLALNQNVMNDFISSLATWLISRYCKHPLRDLVKEVRDCLNQND